MGARETFIVARLEAGELLRDPQVGGVLATIVGLLHVLLLSNGSLEPFGAQVLLVGIGPLAILFLAGPRRGVAHESAFRRLVLTCPLSPADWFWGRVLGLHALTAAYALLVAPAFALEISVAHAPLWATANALVGLAGLGSLCILLGLGLGARDSPRGAGALALAAFAILVGYRAVFAVRAFDEGLARQGAMAAVALLPSIPVAMSGGVVMPVGAPAWALALAALLTLAAVGAWAMRRCGVPAPAWPVSAALWVAGALVLGLASGAGARPSPLEVRAVDEAAWARFDLLPFLTLLALAPAFVSWRRRRFLRRPLG